MKSSRWAWLLIPVSLSIFVIARYSDVSGLKYLVEKGIDTFEQFNQGVGYMNLARNFYLLLIWGVTGIIALIFYLVRKIITSCTKRKKPD